MVLRSLLSIVSTPRQEQEIWRREFNKIEIMKPFPLGAFRENIANMVFPKKYLGRKSLMWRRNPIDWITSGMTYWYRAYSKLLK